MKKIILTAAFLFTLTGWAQTGIIKGIVLDKQSESPLEGATVQLMDMEIATGVITDLDGRFILKDVPIGRQSIQISYIGFESSTVPNIEVTTGKDAVVNITLQESFNQLNEVVVSSNTTLDKPKNKLAVVSARQFGIEEVGRFSGGRGDVGRLASNFAGVSAPDDSRNDVIIRGNSPTGLLWRIEGIPVPNPNHYSSAGTTGGPVSALNPNMLKNSDFITSAFPAEYGNAIGGVFDIGLRNGNTDDYEFSAQAGLFSGVEANAEGPMGEKGSFLVAARYSLIGLTGGAGTSATPNYGDLSFNFNFGKGKLGSLSLFGIGGTSDIEFLGDDIEADDLFAAEDEDAFVKSGFGVLGLKHSLPIGKNSFVRTVIGYSTSQSQYTADRYFDKDTPQENIILYTKDDETENRFTISSLFNSKINNKITLRTGLVYENLTLDYINQDREEQPDNDGDGFSDLVTLVDVNESLNLFQPFVQGQFRLSEKLTLNAGLNGQYSNLNKQFALGPRAGLSFDANDNHRFSLGYGLHYQNIPSPILFLNENVNGNLAQTNRDLEFVRSAHYVMGYDVKLGNKWRGKVEAYYQDIDNAPVHQFSSSYSTLTEGADFGFSKDAVSLVNEGTAFNQGIELTLEKFFSQNYYMLFTSSFYQSKYKGSDGVERNSPFNNGQVINFLAGKEFVVGKARKNRFFMDTKVTFSGGRYYTPINLEASRAAKYEVLYDDLAYSLQYDNYFRWDVKLGFKINSKTKKRSHQFYVDLQNVTNNKNIFSRMYNRLTDNIDREDQIGFFPDFGYRFQF
ncbi:TonB-dependent receptor [Flagellimonas pacifica]|uniref:Outer membrane receptor proteins, mostly Fe transport n=1 Tax=Flagellimonas pacifica TaxID=1247520 RepID=A0A285MBX1_9FLAO|nr:TonB-dependent receptor [Allomuricauda parva]SNY94664.1 Outer membrane receptor proteins, mostly Fe transport [Allomuricauda parva]